MKLAHCKLCVLLCCFTATSALTYANSGSKGVSMEITQQKKQVHGKVLDETGEPLAGATVQIKGATSGAITDGDGNFSGLSVKESDVLQIGYIGYEQLEVAVKGKTELIVTLKPNVEALEEVVVAAFAKQKKESVVASIESVKPSDLKVPSSNLTTSLAGRVAGLISYQRSGEPGKDNATFFIRGVTTFGYAQSPLILLDGFEVSANDLAQVEPDNIEQFSILKDATAAALYGSKGANGVISVTTKQGKEGSLTVSFRHESKISAPTHIPNMVDGVSYMRLYNEAQYNDNPIVSPRYSAQKIQNTLSGLNPMVYPNIDWYGEMFKDFTYNQHYTLNASGGGKVVRYYMAVSYDNDTGILKENRTNNFKNNINIDRFNILAKVNINLTRTTRAEVNINSVFRNYTGPFDEATDIFKSVMAGNPVEFPKFYEPDEQFAGVKHILFGSDPSRALTNPYAQMVRGYKDGFESTVTSQFTLEQDLDFITRGLMFRGKASIANYSAYESKRSYDPYLYSLDTYDEFTNTYKLGMVHEGTDVLGNPATTRQANSQTYYELGFHYNNTFNDVHDFGAVAIYTQEEDKNTNGGSTIQETLPARNQGIRGRVNYAFDGRYMAEVSLTYNGSEKFDKSKRWGLFPAIGVGYMMSNEKYWKPLESVLPKFKLKYSWGKVGNDEIASASDRFFFLSDISFGGDGYRWGNTFTNVYGGYNISRYANPYIQWEISEKQNMGAEFNLFNLADLQIEYFTENRSKIYMQRQDLPPSMGLAAGVGIYGNLGEVKSRGVDASIDIKKNINKDLYVTGRFNFTYAHGEYVVASEPIYENTPWRSKIGYPVTQSWGYIAERLFIDENDVANSPTQSFSTTQAGDIKYKDINGDGKISNDDLVPLGYPTTPEINYGFGFSIGYKNWDLSAFFQGQDRVSFFINSGAIAPFTGYRNALQVIADDHWSADNPVANTFWPRLSAGNNSNNTQQSTWWLRNGAFVRLKTLEVGYSLSDRLIKKTPLKLCRVYFSGSNLFQISKFDLWDPEMGSDGLGYPLQRVYSLGLQVTF
ncbi:TonB-dependent receptor [Parabacteroides sp. AM08-6]|uniref:SusC/RagA family TonB-linked outer membrane protein n=1 Tax=Parabacteroides sp. AM08-6 TaxID=2292053 RepID=UPI000F00F87A|nr:TonB-dependent receptor [Parabacteroides sp. AM08-6]RHJ81234.1 TonB-dependent receptor [Parabacteroides sp. AM08-6]